MFNEQKQEKNHLSPPFDKIRDTQPDIKGSTWGSKFFAPLKAQIERPQKSLRAQVPYLLEHGWVGHASHDCKTCRGMAETLRLPQKSLNWKIGKGWYAQTFSSSSYLRVSYNCSLLYPFTLYTTLGVVCNTLYNVKQISRFLATQTLFQFWN